MTNRHQPQQRRLGTAQSIEVGMATPWGFFSTIIFLVIGGFIVSLYLNETLSEGVATVLALICGAIWYALAFRKGRQFVETMDALPPQRQFSSPRSGAPVARQTFGHTHGASVGTAAGIGAATSVAHMVTQHANGDPFLREPMVNIDGTPMMGDIDINGNPYGVTSVDTPVPALNVDGTLMPDGIDGLDTNGNPFGSTSDETGF